MRIVNVGVLAPTNKGIPLGVQGENRATEVEFDTRPWFREYPSGTVSAVARRNGDPAPYPLSLDVADGTAVWQVSDTDTAKAGEGAVELTMTSGGARVRSLTFKTLVTASLTDAPVDDDAWYGWLDKAVVKVDETVQSAQRKMAEVDAEWTGIKADVTSKVEECGKAAAQAADDAHHAKVDAQATAKALESAEGSVAKAEAAATRAEGAAEQAYGAAGQAGVSAGNASAAASDAREASAQAAGWADMADKSATRAAASEANAALSATSAADSAERATAQKVAAENAKDAAESYKAGAEAAKGEAAASASNAESSATAAAKSASDAAASVGAVNVIAPKTVDTTAISSGYKALSIGDAANSDGQGSVAIGYKASSSGSESIAIGDTANARGPFDVAIGELSDANAGGSVAVGYNSVAYMANEFSVGNNDYTREITHVSEPTAASSAATKKYTDDNDAKTLSEAKKYTDENISNALVGTVSGKLLHVEDAWPGKPLGLTIDGAYKQGGTPSPENPVPIEVIENPTLKVTGRNVLYVGTELKPSDCDKTSDHSTKRIIKPGEYVEAISFNNHINTQTITDVAFGTGSVSFTSHSVSGYGVAVGVGLVPGVTYEFSGIPSLLFYASDGQFISYNNVSPVTVPATARYCAALYNTNSKGDKFFANGVISPISATTYAPYVGTYLSITLPAEHPYLAKLPDGTADTIEVDKDGNVSLVARVGKAVAKAANTTVYHGESGASNYANIAFPTAGNNSSLMCNNYIVSIWTQNSGYVYCPSEKGLIVRDSRFTSLDVALELLAGTVIYVATPVTVYPLGKITVPSLPDSISNVWTDAELTTNMSMTYKQDVNVVIAGLTAQIAALKGTNDIAQGDSTASPDDAIVAPDNDVKLI